MTSVDETADSLPDPDAVDPELLELPSPPKGRRLATLALMALVVVASAVLALSLRHDLAYFFAPSDTVELGPATEIDPADLTPNTHVTIQGHPMMSRTVRYRRVLTGGEYLVFPLAGQRTIYVHAEDMPDTLSRTEFTGRLVTFGQLGARVSAVEGSLAQDLGLPVTDASFLLLADEAPGTYAWALLLALLCGLFIVVNLFLLYRWFRPIEPATRE